ncbi:ATP-binding protein [Flavobacterium piscis]|uniref:histidine kinase n=1 Tax=Flavobacterium piscis TaxID=1114874 RepID=A0ABU1YBM8_9FLAO|nr:ATP-binding protein [Flavobacterium piscis]MDR7211656.1 signal transduction histidine kinase [Flavobacterium piscis]
MKLSTQILLAFTLVILLSVADSYSNYNLSIKVQRNSQFLSESEEIIRNSNKAHRAIIEMQSGLRGYLLTNDSSFLDFYYDGLKNVPPLLKEQKKRIGKNPVQLSLLDSITALHNLWLVRTADLINAQKNNPQYYQTVYDTKQRLVGKNINDAITKKFKKFDKIEYKTRKHHSDMLLHSLSSTRTFSLIFLCLTIFTGLCSTFYIVLMITNRINSMVRLADNISKGKFTIVRDSRNDELSALSASLNIMSGKLEKNIHDLENKNEELNKFAYVVSHDLKAPIRGIHNVITWIGEDLSDELSPQLKKYLQIIPQRTQRMEALINGLLDYARINRKTPTELVDVNVLVHEIAESIVPRNFTINIENLPEIFTERLKLEQIFVNLISNAVKYSKPETGFIKITGKKTMDYFEFSIKDNGIGIAVEYHQKIFEIFQTLREKNEIESTGVGLAIVKKIIDEQRETIIVKSELGKGTEFIFTWRNSKTV